MRHFEVFRPKSVSRHGTLIEQKLVKNSKIQMRHFEQFSNTVQVANMHWIDIVIYHKIMLDFQTHYRISFIQCVYIQVLLSTYA